MTDKILKPHVKAFKIYMDLGDGRTLQEVEQQTGIDFDTLNDWSMRFAWDNRIKDRQRDTDRARALLHDKSLTKIKTDMMTALDSVMMTMGHSSIGAPFAVNNAADLRNLAQAYEAMTRAHIALSTADLEADKESGKTMLDLLNSMGDDDFASEDYDDVA